jgi:hypothetical protein
MAEATDERPLATEQVAQLAADEQEAAEGQGVGGDDPLPVVDGEVKRALRRRERDVHDRGVQHHHQLSDAEEREDRPSIGAGDQGCIGARGAHQGPSGWE